MRLAFPKFGGIMPRRDSEELADAMAQTAQNVDLTSGKLLPISVSGNVYQWHDGTNRISQIASADFFQVGTPVAPTLNSTSRIFQTRLLTVEEFVFVTYVDANDELVVEELLSFVMLPKRTQWTETGVSLYFSKRQAVTRVFPNDGRVYKIHGPRFRVRYGSRYLPLTEPTYSDPILPGGQIPLVNTADNDEQYGALEAIDYSGPVHDADIFVENYDSITWSIPAHGMTITFDLNYTYPTRRTVYYVQAKVTNDAAAYEGPASALSEPIVIEPGNEITLDVVTPGRLYRSETGGDDFLLIDDIDSSTLETDNGNGTGTYVDRRALARGTVLPPYGDYPTGASRNGSVVHPAGFAVIYYGSVVYVSDYFKHSTYPEEWTIEFATNVMALEIQGGTILVWTAATASEPGKLYGLSGSNPASLSKHEISATHPLLDARSICKIGAAVYYVSEDGLVGIGGGAPQLVTEPHYTRTQWSALTPANFYSKVADNSIFLYDSTTNLRIDLDETLARVTTWTALTGVSLTWKSKLFIAQKPWRPSVARVRAATYPVTMKLYAAESLVATITVADGEGFRLAQFRPERKWEVQIESAYAIDEVILATSMAEVRGG